MVTSGISKYQELEIEYARYCGTKFAIATNTGTSALHLALKSIGIKEGDEVIVPEFTMIASAWAVTYCGATPIFVDCDDDLNIDVTKIEAKITKKTKAIMPVHVYGRICNMEEIIRLAKKYKLRVIEDCCEAQGANVGKYDIACYSFYINKIIPAEEGGMITTNDKRVHDKAQYLKSMSFGDKHDYLHKEIGFNYRMTNTQAIMVLENLKQVNAIQLKRFQIEGWYDKYINPKFKLPKRDVVWVYDIKHPNTNKAIKELNEQGISARYSFKPMSMQPMYLNKNYKKLVAYKKSKEIMYLPVNPLMTEEMVQIICNKINAVI